MNLDVPDHILVDILQLLPAKKLARFICVSRNFQSLIDQISSNTNDPEQLLLNSNSQIQTIDFSESEIKPVTLLDTFPFKGDFNVVGSVNGLVLCRYTKNTDLILINPLTQAHITIQVNHGPRHYFVHGFGYDKNTREYIIVLIDRDNDVGSTWIQIWSSKIQIWFQMVRILDPGLWGFSSHIKPQNRHLMNLNIGLFANGAIYWKIQWSPQDLAVLRFDLETTNFDVIQSPISRTGNFDRIPINMDDQEYEFDFDLVVLEDRVCFVYYNCERLCTDVWELNHGNWIKKMIIPPYCYFVAPVIRLKNGEFVLVKSLRIWLSRQFLYCGVKRKSKFYFYDHVKKDSRWVEGDIDLIDLHDVRIPYRKSLVSIENMCSI